MVKQGAQKAMLILFYKLRIVLKELNETAIWLRIIERSRIVQAELLADIIQENKDLCRIFTASLKTARNARKWQLINND